VNKYPVAELIWKVEIGRRFIFRKAKCAGLEVDQAHQMAQL